MSPDRALLDDIVYSARLALRYLSGISLEQFLEDLMRQDAVIRRLEVIGEAVKWVSADAKAGMPNIPWRRIQAMRNFMIHDYWEVDEEIVWSTVQDDLPVLIAAIEAREP